MIYGGVIRFCFPDGYFRYLPLVKYISFNPEIVSYVVKYIFVIK